MKDLLKKMNALLNSFGQTKVVCLFFGLYFLLGIWIVPDYGISWDEPGQRNHGLVSWQYINEYYDGKIFDEEVSDKDLKTYRDRDYGVIFQLTCFWLERKVLNIQEKDHRSQYLLRHYAVFFLFFISVIFFYKMLKWRFDSWKWGLLAAICLLLSPRIFGHSFYNPKDLVTFSWFLISVYTCIRFLEKRTLISCLLHAICCAFLINARVVGICIPVLTIIFLLIDFVYPLSNKAGPKDSKSKNLLPRIALLLLYPIAFIFVSIQMWPFLWEAPLDNFVIVWDNMKQFRWNSEVLYWNKYIKAADLPWHYIPSWLFATTPIAFGLLFLLGAFKILKNFTLSNIKIYKNSKERMDLIFLAFFIGPLGAVILLESVMYDGWRQMYFIYVGFLATALVGLQAAFVKWQKAEAGSNFNKIGKVLCFLFAINLVGVLIFMIRFHPHQNVYFNKLVDHNIVKRMEMDYWCNSYKQLYEELLLIDQSDTIYVRGAGWPSVSNLYMLKPADRKRFKYNYEKKDRGYYISNYRFKREHKKFMKNKPPFDQEIYSIKVKGSKIGGIYKYVP